MSRLGKRPIKTDDNITISVENNKFIAKSTKGERILDLPDEIKVKIENGIITTSRNGNSKFEKSQHGLITRLISGIIADLSKGAKKTLEFKGTGYRVRVEGTELILNMGYSHEIKLDIPEEIAVNVVKNSIVIEGIDRQKVGEFAAKVRKVRPPEVYKGKGIKYSEEVIRRKAGKTAQSAGKAA
ncbi:MAG: 50S ribosomal protein L6 [Patescibacteria group bacterium]|jgi:large subunit ribosomal protein L6